MFAPSPRPAEMDLDQAQASNKSRCSLRTQLSQTCMTAAGAPIVQLVTPQRPTAAAITA